MSFKNTVIILIAVFFFAACAPKQLQPARPVYVDPEDILFAQAEELFQAKLYEKALIKYTEYLSRFPNGRLADAALIKTGAAWSYLGNNAKALSCYNRLIEDYPKSPFIPDAMVETLVVLYNKGKYNEAIKRANDVIESNVAGINIIRTYLLLGDAHLATGSPKDAVNSYILAFNKAKDPAKETIIAKINEASMPLEPGDIISFLKQLKDKPPAGYLMYRLGQNKAEKEKYNDAEKILSQFIERFPEHENALKAQKLIESIRKKGVYSKYTIGCLLPLSGAYESFGRRALKGIELAINQFCSQSIQPALKLIIKDTESDADKAATAAKELFEEQHVAAIIGPIFTAESAAMVAQDKGVPIITITQKNNITGTGDYVFRNFFTPMMQVHTLVSYMIEDLGLGSFAILYPDDNYGTTFMNLFWDEVTAYGGKVVGVESYNIENTDFADPIKKLVGLYYEVPEDLKTMDILIEDDEDDMAKDKEAGKNDDISEDEEENKEEQEPEAIVDFDAIFIPDALERAGLIIPQLAFYDVKDAYLLGTNLWHCDNLIKMARRYVQNAIMPDIFFAESSSKQVGDFVAVFEQSFKEKPEFIEAVAYDSAMILFQIVSRPDIRYRSSIKSALMNLNNFQGATGLTSFDNNGEIKRKLYLLRIKGNKFIELNQK
ncbi:MAG: penicillin-binding protein activator [Thermodesulfobacteriota bacterium]|nr:penicillin-binding protein activator [Thermodesulfobacteriota bacterium]